MNGTPLTSPKFGSPDLTSLDDSLASDERLDSDLEADLRKIHSTDELDTSVSCEEFSSIASHDVASTGSFTLDTANHIADVRQSTLLQKSLLTGISNQISSFGSRPEVGQPTCLSLKRHLIVGTEKGVLLIFDVHQILRLSLGTPATAISCIGVQVTALSQNRDGSQLVSGYRNGRLAIWRLSTSKSNTMHNDIPFSSANSTVEHVFSPSEHASGSPCSTINAVSKQRRLSTDRLIGHLLCVVDDAHGVDQAIASCAFTTIPSLLVSVDTGGSVFQVRYKRVLAGVAKDAACFFSGSRGEICAMDALGSESTRAEHSSTCIVSGASSSKLFAPIASTYSLATHALIAMASFSKLIVAALRPQIEIVLWRKLEGPSSCLPLLSWNWDPRPCSCAASSTAILAFGRGSTVQLLRLSALREVDADSVKRGVKVELLLCISMASDALSLKWMSHKNQLVVMDVSETVHLLDTRTGRQIESMDLSTIQLSYQSKLYSSLRDAGKISGALALAGRRSCSLSIVSHNSQLLLLSQTGIHLITLRSWLELVRSLFSSGSIETALWHCTFALEKAGSDVVRKVSEVVPDADFPMSQLKPIILSLLQQYLIQQLSSGVEVELTAESVRLLLSIGEYLDDSTLLFTDLYPLLETNESRRAWFYIGLSQLIRQLPLFGQPAQHNISDLDRVFCYRIPPNITMAYLHWCLDPEYEGVRCESLGQYNLSHGKAHGHQWADSCLLRLPLHCFDLNEAVRLCRAHQLFTAYLHLYTDILLDFKTPFSEFLRVLSNDSTETADNGDTFLSFGEECIEPLILLLRSGLAAVSCSNEPLPHPLNGDIPNQLFNMLVMEHQVSPSGCALLPNLHLILQHNPVDFLNMLAISVSSDAFFTEGELGHIHQLCLYHKLITCVLDILERELAPPPAYSVDVFQFVVRQLTSSSEVRTTAVCSRLPLFFKAVCNSMTDCTASQKMSFEAATVDLLSLDLLPDVDECLALARSSGLYHICEFIHRIRGQPEEAFKDQINKLKQLMPFANYTNLEQAAYPPTQFTSEVYQLVSQVFAYFERIFCEKYANLLTISVAEARNLLVEHLLIFAAVDPCQTLHLLFDTFKCPIHQILSSLLPGSYCDSIDPDNETAKRLACFWLLRMYFLLRHRAKGPPEDPGAINPAAPGNRNDHNLSSKACSWDQFLKDPINPEVLEFFVRLHTVWDPKESAIVQLLIDHPQDYRAQTVLQVLSSDRFPNVAAHVLEASGDYEKAFELYQQIFCDQWRQLVDRYSNTDQVESEPANYSDTSTVSFEQSCEHVRLAAECWFTYCDRLVGTRNLGVEWTPETIWFKVVDTLLLEQSNLVEQSFKTQMIEIFYSMLSYASPSVSLPSIMLYILKTTDSSTTVNLNDQTSALLTRLVTTCQMEVDQMALNKRMARQDLTKQQIMIAAKLCTGVYHSILHCANCSSSIREHVCSSDQCRPERRAFILAFRCGHVCHQLCSPDAVCPLCAKEIIQDKPQKTFNQLSRGMCILERQKYADDPIQIDKPVNHRPPNPFDTTP